VAPVKFVTTLGGQSHHVEIHPVGALYRVTIDERAWQVDARLHRDGIGSLLVDGHSYVASVTPRDGAAVVAVDGETYAIQVEEESRYIIRTRGGAAGGHVAQTLRAPLPGRITHVAVAVGDTVKAGDALVVVEAMKMENELRASGGGTVAEVRVAAGATVNPGDILVVIE
jgi:biotin carboxyl carrier protein